MFQPGGGETEPRILVVNADELMFAERTAHEKQQSGRVTARLKLALNRPLRQNLITDILPSSIIVDPSSGLWPAMSIHTLAGRNSALRNSGIHR